jgi:hypothetical protein
LNHDVAFIRCQPNPVTAGGVLDEDTQLIPNERFADHAIAIRVENLIQVVWRIRVRGDHQ